MEFDENSLAQLAEAPPSLPTADDIDSTKAATAANIAHVLSQPGAAPPPKPGNVQLPADLGTGSFQDKLAASLNKAKQIAAQSGRTPSWAQLWMGATTDALATPPAGAPAKSGEWESALANRDASQPTQGLPQPKPRGLGGLVNDQLADEIGRAHV
jgi:hypothetical protein